MSIGKDSRLRSSYRLETEKIQIPHSHVKIRDLLADSALCIKGDSETMTPSCLPNAETILPITVSSPTAPLVVTIGELHIIFDGL